MSVTVCTFVRRRAFPAGDDAALTTAARIPITFTGSFLFIFRTQLSLFAAFIHVLRQLFPDNLLILLQALFKASGQARYANDFGLFAVARIIIASKEHL
ncbi:hypothetical protein [[Enterobacter] lignolyticus]|nr:hypothetical protein [[Enterobacter] lignolyticus]